MSKKFLFALGGFCVLALSTLAALNQSTLGGCRCQQACNCMAILRLSSATLS